MRRTDGPFPIYEIVPGALYQRGKLHRMPLATKTAGLKYYGITHAVALAPLTPDPEMPVPYTHQPIPDGALKDAEAMLSLAAGLATEINMGGVVLTMCNAGRNRSGLLSALILAEMIGLPGEATLEMVRHHRPNAIANPHFEAFLRSLP